MSVKILILEDDPDIARFYEAALREDGSCVTVCVSFEQARDHLRREQPDTVVTDIRVGEYNGLQLAWLFRQRSPYGRVVVVSGYDDAVLRRDVGALRGEFLLKPVRVTQLQTAVYACERRPADFHNREEVLTTTESNRNILILDDDPSVAALYASALERAGYHVIVCTGYEEAREYLKHNIPSGVLTDVRVGQYNGFQLVMFFRSMSPDGAVLVVSGHDDGVIRSEAAQLDALFLPKPVSMNDVTSFFARKVNAGSETQPQ